MKELQVLCLDIVPEKSGFTKDKELKLKEDAKERAKEKLKV